MDNFLDLCKWVQPRIGYSGTWTTTEDATADLAKIVSHVQESESRLCSLYQDWEFLRSEEEVDLVPEQADYDPPDDLGNYSWAPWTVTENGIEGVVHVLSGRAAARMPESTTSGTPRVAIINPDRTFRLWPAPRVEGTLLVQYHKVPDLLTDSEDESPIPKRFWQAVGWDAVRTLAMVESDGPLAVYATDQANRWLSQLIADQLPDHRSLHYGSTETPHSTVVRAE
jgi:hypothetical protein